MKKTKHSIQDFQKQSIKKQEQKKLKGGIITDDLVGGIVTEDVVNTLIIVEDEITG